MGIFNSSNPTDWTLLDGIYIDDTSPPPSVTGVPTSVAILVGQFERGSPSLQSVGSTGQLYELYGNNVGYSGNVALQNKSFGLLKIIRVVASDALNASYNLLSAAPATIITLTALWAGQYGNKLKVTVAAGSLVGVKITVADTNPNSVWQNEVYDNVLVTAAGFNQAALTKLFINSNLVSATLVAVTASPAVLPATSLAGGSDGTVADTDYQNSIVSQSQSTLAGNMLFLDEYTSVRNGYLQVSMAATTDKMAILAGQPGDSVTTAIADVANSRDSDGRMIYSYPYVFTTIGSTSTLVNPASFYAALLSQIAPQIDPAYAANTQYLGGIDSLDGDLQRSDYINLMAAGISAFEFDADIGMKIKSGIVTQIADSSKLMVFRRRMTDYIIQSLARFMKNYQNGLNSLQNRKESGNAISAFNTLLENSGVVPKDTEVTSGKASLIDTTSLNTDASVAAGKFIVIYKRRIYSSMRFIVLQTEIGESVVVTEASS